MTAVKTETKVYPRIYEKIVLTLENCILSDLDSKPTPSELDGLDPETETDLRILGCELIQTAGILLRLPQVAMATGQVLFQRFFYSKSFVRHSMETTAMSCVCLASKIEEAPRRIRDVINVFHHIKQVRLQKQLTPIILDQNYINLKSQVIKAERRVLKELGFCVHVNHHPHKLIVMYLKYLEHETNQNLMQRAWNYMNDSFRTDVFVRYQPEKIACACIYLTARELGIALPNNPPWYGVFKATEQEISDIIYRILALYKRTKPNLERLDEAVEKLKQAYDTKKKDKLGASTPPATITTDRTNGAHNAWGGFIARAEPLPPKEEERSPRRKSRSRSPRSRSRSPHSKSSSPNHRSPDDDKAQRRKRSRTPVKSGKKKVRHYSRSPSRSPYKKHKKSDKKYDKYDRYEKYDKYDRKSAEKERYRDDYDYKSSRKDKQYRYEKNYYNGKDKYRSEKSKYRDRSPRERRW